jgi:hypothetical protein
MRWPRHAVCTIPADVHASPGYRGDIEATVNSDFEADPGRISKKQKSQSSAGAIINLHETDISEAPTIDGTTSTLCMRQHRSVVWRGDCRINHALSSSVFLPITPTNWHQPQNASFLSGAATVSGPHLPVTLDVQLQRDLD